MPIAEIQLPNGKIAELEVPEGASHEQIAAFAESQFGRPTDQQLARMQPQETQQPQQQPIGRIEAGAETISNIPLVGPRAKAALAVLGAKAYGMATDGATKNENVGDLYDEAFKNQLTKLNQARSQYPVQSFATNLVPDLIAGGKALKATKLAGNSFKAALAGGAMLGSAGAVGETKDLREGKQVLNDALAGGAYGAGGGAAGYSLAKGISGAGKIIKSGVNMISPPSAQKVLSKIIAPEQARQLATKLETRQSQGRISALPDIGGEKVSALSRTLAKQDGSRESINEFLNNRTATSAKRTSKLINGKIADQNFLNNLENLNKAKEEIAGPLYAKAYGEAKPISNLDKLIADERLPTAISQARKDFGISYDIPDNSIEALHGARQQVDDIINSAKRAGENNKARSYIELRNKINNTLYEASPTFKKADDTYSGFAKIEQAQKDGLDFDKFGSGDEIKSHFAKLNLDEKDAFKIGLRENLIRRVSGSQDSVSGARRIFGNSLQREKIKSVFDKPKDYNDFARKMLDEIRIYDVKQRILGGSRTDINLNDEAQILDKIAKGAVDVKTFGMSNLVMAGKDAITKRYYGINEKNSKDLALIITNPKKSIDALRAIANKADKKQKPLVQEFIKDYAPQLNSALVATSMQRNQEKTN